MFANTTQRQVQQICYLENMLQHLFKTMAVTSTRLRIS